MVQALSQIQEIDHEADAARERQLFYCWCARRALERVPDPHPDLLIAVEAKEQWLLEQINDEELDRAHWAGLIAYRVTCLH